MPLSKRAAAEFLGTFWLVFGGCGSAVLAAAFPASGIGFLGRGAGLRPDGADHGLRHRPHLRLPSESGGLGRAGGGQALRRGGSCRPTSSRRCSAAMVARGVLLRDRQRQAGLRTRGGFASNGYGEHSPGGYSHGSCLVAEVVLTFMFLMIILGATDKRAPAGFRAHRHRPGPDADPPDRHSGHEPVGEPRAQHRTGGVRRRLGLAAALALLGGADRRRGHRGHCVSDGCRQR